MPRTSEMRDSKFLQKSDVGRGVLLTVKGCVQKNVAKEGADPTDKWCLTFVEEDKPFVLNATNVQICEQVFGSDDTDRWIGKQIVLYTDPNVSYQGKLIGGIRARAPRQAAPAAKPAPVQAPPPPVAEVEIFEDDIPFMWLVGFIVPATLVVHVVLHVMA